MSPIMLVPFAVWHLLGCCLLRSFASALNAYARVAIIIVFALPLMLILGFGPDVTTITHSLGPTDADFRKHY